MRVYNRSVYCKRNRAKDSFEELIRDAKFKYIFLSYNNEGIMSKDEVKFIMSKYGKYDLKIKKHKRFKTSNILNKKHKISSTDEYLHILQKSEFDI